MTNREKEILELIRKNPMISQQELADILGITRSSVAVHITNLLKKGYIAGKGYIINDETYACILGGANIDTQGFPNDKFIFSDSNPGKVKVSLGGVGRNIGENLVKLGVDTRLISAVGDDFYGNKILEDARLVGLNMVDSFIFKGQSSSTYLCILNEKGDMVAAISHMDIYDNITIDLIEQKKYIIDNSKLCVIDTNIPEKVIEYVVTHNKNTAFFLDTVSTTKAKRVKDIIGYFHTIKPNKLEAEILSGMEINDNDDIKKAGEFFINKGVKNVFITLGKDGVFYCDSKNTKLLKTPQVKVVNATGAGDAFVAGLAYSYLNNYDLDYTACFSSAASILALSHENTINPSMSLEKINNKMKEIGLC